MLQISRREYPGMRIVALRGELDQDSVKDFSVYLSSLNNEKEPLILEWTRVNKVVYAVLPALHKTFGDLLLRRRVAFCGMQPAVQKVLQTAPFYPKIAVYVTQEEAVQGLAAMPAL